MIAISIDEESKARIRTLVSRLDESQQDNVIKKGVIAASSFVLNILLWNVSGIILRIRTGNLARSMGMRVEKQGHDWVGIVGSGALVVNPQVVDGQADFIASKSIRMSYADILETGGRIEPTGGRQFLTIPLDAAMTPAGVARFTAPQVRDGQTKYDGSFIRGGIIFGKLGKKEVPLFKLVPSVTIPAKLYMSETAQSSTSRVGEVMADAIEKGLSP